MTRKLEEEFNLPPIDEAKKAENPVEVVEEDKIVPFDQQQAILANADKIDAALPQVTGLDALDKDMDAYAQKAMETYEQLCDLGMNVEDRHAGQIFEINFFGLQSASAFFTVNQALADTLLTNKEA